MYQASKKFGDAIAGSNRKFNTRLLENEKVLVESVKNFTITSGAEEITIGSAVASYVQATIENKGIALSGKEVSLEIGVEVDGEMEYIPMGLYTIQNPKIESNKVTFTAYDRLASRCNGAYYSKLGYPVDAVDILAEISTMTGVAIDTSTLQRGIQINQRAIIEEGDYNEETEESEVITTYVNPFDGYTYKETIGFIAGLFGKFAICGRTGMIEFRWYQGIDYEIPSNIFYNDLQETEESFSIKRLICDNSDQTLSSGSGATGISMQNPVMTQSILDGVYNTVQGLVFTPAALRFIGDTRLDIGDIVTAVKNDGTKFTIPIISLITSYDGGLMQTIASYGNTAEEDDSDTKGPITEMAERVEYELAFVKKLMVDNLTATNATIKNLSGDVLKFKTGEFETLKTDVANFKQTFTDDLQASNAKINTLESDHATFKEATATNLNATNARIANIEADYLKATDAKLTYATITNLNTTNAEITKLKTKDAEIDKLVATKATITDLNAAVGRVGVLESSYANLNTLVNGNLTSDNIQNLTLTSKNTTIENGMIKNAMIENLAFDKITGMDINTTNLTVHSSDGKSKWSDNTIQISDANRVRVQIGKDASNDYSMSVWDKNGNLIWDALGATENTIQRKIIRDNVVADNANISGSKLDINSVIREVNGSTTKLKSSVINMNDKNQTLDVVFNELATTVEEIEVGGRNLARNTSSEWCNWIIPTANYKNFAGTISYIYPGDKNINDIFTVSFDIEVKKFTAGDSGNFTIYLQGAVDGSWSIGNPFPKYNFTAKSLSGDYTEHVSYVCKITSQNIADASKFEFGYRCNYSDGTGKFRIKNLKVEKGNKPTDWTPAPEDTQSQINNISEITTSHTTSISTMQGQISSLISEDVAIKGNYDTLVSKYNSTVQTVNGMKTTIGEHTSSINNVSSKITTIEANLSGITTRVSASEEKFDNLQIGGRNLFHQSSLTESNPIAKANWKKTIINNISSGEFTNEGYHFTTNTVGVSDSNGPAFAIKRNSCGLKTGDTVTFSVDVKGTVGTGNPLIQYWSTTPNSSNYWARRVFGDSLQNVKKDTFTRYKVVVTLEDLHSSNNENSWTDYFAVGGAYNSDLYIRNIKLEKGNKATDYTPAPEDTTDAIKSVETIATQTADKFSWLVKSGDSASNVILTDHMYDVIAQNINLTGKVTFSSLNAEAQKKINDIDTKAGNAQTSANNALTSAKQYTDNAVGGIEVGGVNLISDTRDMKSWVKGGKLTITYDQLDIKNNTNAIKVVNSKSTAGNAYLEPSNRGPLSSGKHTVSFYAKTDSTSGADVTVFLTYEYTKTFKINNIWTQYIITFDIANDIPVTNNFFWFNFFGTTDAIYFCYAKLEKGNKATDWSPNPEDYLPQANLVSNWTTNSTWIDGGKIYTGSITADKIATDAIKSRNYVANSTGSFLNLADGTFDSKYLKWDASGNITAKGGTIGKYKITDQWLVTGSGSTCTGIGGNQAFWAGADSSDSAPFRVGYDGKFVSSNADISGKISATSGKVGKYEITDTYLKTGSGSTCSGFGSDYAFWAGNDEAKYAPFKVEYDGTLNIEHIVVHGNQEDVYMKIGKDFLTIQDVNTSAHIGLDGFDFDFANSRIKTGDQGIELYGDTPYIDFHYNNSYADYTSRIIAQSNWDCLSFTGSILLGADLYANGWIYNSSGGHYTWDGRTDAYLGCGNYNNTNNIYYYAGYHAFYVNGDSGSGMMYIETSGVSSRKGFRNSSDERIKKDFKHFDDDFINSYMQLEPVKYRFKDDSDDKYHIGFKAQNVDKTLNTYGKKHDEQFGICVASHINQDYAEKAYGIENMNEVYTLAYDELIGANTFMIQKTRKDLLYQAGKIDIHEAIINDLQFKIAKMEKKIEQLTKALA